MARGVIGLLAVLVLAAGPADAIAATNTCRPPTGATVEAHSSFATVYRFTKAGNTFIRACVRGSARPVKVASDAREIDDHEFDHVTLAGRYVGWTVVRRTRYQDSWAYAAVFDLKKRRLRWTRGGPYRPAGEAPRVTDFALARTGRAAFVTREFRVDYPENGQPGEWRTVWAVDAAGGRALEEGPRAIDLTSLDVSGFTVTWTSGGQPRSAQLY